MFKIGSITSATEAYYIKSEANPSDLGTKFDRFKDTQWRNHDFFQGGQTFQSFSKISGIQKPLFKTPMKGRMMRCFENKRDVINANLSIEKKTIILMVTVSITMLLFYFTESP